MIATVSWARFWVPAWDPSHSQPTELHKQESKNLYSCVPDDCMRPQAAVVALFLRKPAKCHALL